MTEQLQTSATAISLSGKSLNSFQRFNRGLIAIICGVPMSWTDYCFDGKVTRPYDNAMKSSEAGITHLFIETLLNYIALPFAALALLYRATRRISCRSFLLGDDE